MAFTTLWQRDSLSSDVQGVPHTFSSWDTCMTKAYCKWPAIIGIILASLIALSLLFCLVRCLCFGAECCCGCLSCCDSCCRPSSGRRSRNNNGSKFADPPAAYQGYQPAPPVPMNYGGPQYARFDARNGDGLPPMPSWESAAQRRVEDVEMGRLGTAAQTGAPPSSRPPPQEGYAYADPSIGRQQDGVIGGGDLGDPDGTAYGGPYVQRRYGEGGLGAGHQGYGNGYDAYAPSESTRYEPSQVVYDTRDPLASPHADTRAAPSASSWRDV